jgi:hypothetical protein
LPCAFFYTHDKIFFIFPKSIQLLLKKIFLTFKSFSTICIQHVIHHVKIR